MKAKIVNRLYLIATTVFILLSVDAISIYLLSDNKIEVCCDYPDFSKHPGHSHNHQVEDEVLLRDSYLSQQNTEIINDFIDTLNLIFKDCYISDFWRPPKVS